MGNMFDYKNSMGTTERVIFSFQVAETPRELAFLSILQHLLQIDANDVISDVIWNVIDKLVSGATLLVRKSEADRLLADGARRIEKAVEGQRQLGGVDCGGSCTCPCHSDPRLSLSPSAARKQKEAAAAAEVVPASIPS